MYRKLIFVLTFWVIQCWTQDLTKPKYLLQDLDVQLEANDAINAMYNFSFDSATTKFNELKMKFPEHPLPYFLFGLMEYWKILPNEENQQYDKSFLAYMDTAISKAEVFYKKDKKDIEANFFLAAAYGFKGRLLSDRKKWTKSAVAGKNSLNHLQLSKGQNDLSPEFLFGDALYNYYSVWIPENYPFLKPVMAMFPKGEKNQGINQLKEVAYNAFYTRIEALSYLMRIYFVEENDAASALPIAKHLHEQFPNNPFFHRYYARICYQMGDATLAERLSLEILEKREKKYPFYEEVSGRYAAFFLGYIYRFRFNQWDKAKKYLLLSVELAEKVNQTNVGFYLYSLQYLAQMAIKEKNNDLAKEYYQKIKKNADKDHPTYKEAKKFLKEN
ncbi:MAG: tol-pal system protein YbgF [Cytophagales bacterium]